MENKEEKKVEQNKEIEEDKKKLELLIKENTALTKDLQKMTKFIYKWVIWQRVYGFLKMAIVAIVVLAGVFYLPPLMGDVISKFNEIYLNLVGLND